MEQEPYRGFVVEEFAENPDPRVPCVLLLDTSSSMEGRPLAELNAGLRQFRDELCQDNLAARRVEVAILTFGGQVHLQHDFTPARSFFPQDVGGGGGTPMAEAVIRGIKHLEERKRIYQANGIAYYRPWMFLITDGEPTGDAGSWSLACQGVAMGEQQKKFTFFAIGTAEANFDKLRALSPARPPIQLKQVAFRDLFHWLSNSLTRVSQSQVGTSIALAPATGDDGWGVVPT